MISKKAYISGIIIFLLLFALVFFLYMFKHKIEKKAILIKDKSIPLAISDSSVKTHLAGDIQTSKSLTEIKFNSAPLEASTSNCYISKPEPVIIYSPLEGKIKYLVKEKDIIKQGDSIAMIMRTFSGQSENLQRHVDIDILKDEIDNQKYSISSAHEDIENIRKRLEELNNKFIDARYAYSTALTDFENNKISKKKKDEIEESFEFSKIHLADLEKMLDGKYTAIRVYEERISELKTMISISDPDQKKPFKVISDFEGQVDEIFFNDSKDAEEGLPLMTVMASNVAFVEFAGKIPFSADGNKATLTIATEKFQAEGTLKLVGYKQNNSSEITSVWVVFPSGIIIQENYIGKKAVLSFQAD